MGARSANANARRRRLCWRKSYGLICGLRARSKSPLFVLQQGADYNEQKKIEFEGEVIGSFVSEIETATENGWGFGQ